MMKTIAVFFFLFSVLVVSVFAQNDIQSLQAKIQEIKAKPANELSMDDVKFLENVVSMNSVKYGKSFQKVVDAQKRIAKSKLKDYDNWLKEKNQSQEKELQLGNEKLKTQAQSEVIEGQQEVISEQKQVIENLQSEISKLKTQINRTKRVNKKLKNEKSELKSIMRDNNEIVKRVDELLSENIDLRENAPQNVKTQLEDTECKVAEMLAQNYILTLAKLKGDKEYLDQLREYFKEHNQYPDEFYDYLNRGQMLLIKLRDSDVPCVNGKAPQVKASIDEFKSIIENKECDFFCQIANFLSDNLWVVGVFVLIIIGLVLLLVIKRR